RLEQHALADRAFARVFWHVTPQFVGKGVEGSLEERLNGVGRSVFDHDCTVAYVFLESLDNGRHSLCIHVSILPKLHEVLPIMLVPKGKGVKRRVHTKKPRQSSVFSTTL